MTDASAGATGRRERLARRRKALGLTQETLAELLDVERSTVVRWERGETEPQPWIRPKLARALQVSADRLDQLLTVGGSGGPRRPGPVMPRQLPAAVPNFTGRAAELQALTWILDDADTGVPGTVVISAIGGTAGVGKTALALHWAHQVAHRFPDGQLHVNLRGFDPASTPASPAEAIRGFLDALGVPPESIPPSPDAQAGLYRSLLADRQMLIVLDNARDEEQVRPLLLPSPASLVLVTSRNQLSGLAVTDGARMISLDVLTHEEARQLLTVRLGAARTAAEPEAIGEIADLCACLPLALAVAAARAAVHQRFSLTGLAAELRGAVGRLEVLDAGDPTVSVQAVFSSSYQQLGPEAARMFRLLGLHPGPDISVRAAASLAAVGESEARRLLRELNRDCLITERVPDRYAFHDLLRAYAADKARDSESGPDRDAAIGRILDHYLHTAHHCSELLQPSHERVALAPPSPGIRPDQPIDERQALAWFEAEHQVLVAAVTFAAETGADRHAWQLSWAMRQYFFRRSYPHEYVTIMSVALAAATRLGDALGQATSLHGLGNACLNAGDYDQARVHLERCLLLYQRLGDRTREAWAQHNLGRLAEAQGRYVDAIGYDEKALRLFRAAGNEIGEALMLNGIGWNHALHGDYQQARAFCEKSLALFATIEGGHSEYLVWDSLGYIEHRLGNFTRAIEHFEFALGLCRNDGERFSEAEILHHLGDARHSAGELPQARDAWQQALAIYDNIRHPDAEKVRVMLDRIDG